MAGNCPVLSLKTPGLSAQKQLEMATAFPEKYPLLDNKLLEHGT